MGQVADGVAEGQGADRMQLHRLAVRRTARQLRHAGHRVVIYSRHARDHRAGDLHVDGWAWVAVRGTVPHAHPTVIHWRNREYRYAYDRIFHNVHLHGVRTGARPNFWALVRLDTGHICMVRDADVGRRLTISVGPKRGRMPRAMCRRECGHCLDVLGAA